MGHVSWTGLTYFVWRKVVKLGGHYAVRKWSALGPWSTGTDPTSGDVGTLAVMWTTARPPAGCSTQPVQQQERYDGCRCWCVGDDGQQAPISLQGEVACVNRHQQRHATDWRHAVKAVVNKCCCADACVTCFLVFWLWLDSVEVCWHDVLRTGFCSVVERETNHIFWKNPTLWPPTAW